MALVKMKRLSLLALKKDRDRLLEEMQRLGCVQVMEKDADLESFSAGEAATAEQLQLEIDRIEGALTLLKGYDTEPRPMFGVLPQVKEDEAADVLAQSHELFDLISTIEKGEARLLELRGSKARARAALDVLSPWEGLEFAPQQIDSLKTVAVMIGRIPAQALDNARQRLSVLAVPGVLEVVSATGGHVLMFAVLHLSCATEGREILEELGFAEENFAEWRHLTPKDAIEKLNGQLGTLEEERVSIERFRMEAAGQIRCLKVLRDTLSVRRDRLSAARRCGATESVFLLEGWVPAANAPQVVKQLSKLSPDCVTALADPGEGDSPPVLLKNNKLTTPFETVVEGYSLPSYEGIDPTAVMAPFFACLFGMMVSDAGYGLIMTIALFLFIRLKKIPAKNARTLHLLLMGGILTVVWGFVYNSFFGFSPLPRRLWLLDSVNDPLVVMGVCIGFGALHLFAGLLTGAVMNIRRGDPLTALSDQLSWLLLVVGLGLLAVPALSGVGKVLAWGGAGLILVLTGRPNRNPLKRLMSGLGALYGLSGWVGDLLSYIRLFGMGLATGVIAMVFNRLIAMVWDSGLIGKLIGAILFVACHAFNLAINVLGAYVHACRLQYIEFFGKFYEEGGKAFRPLAARTKYVSIADGRGQV